QRRAFWNKHEKAIEAAKIGGLVLVSMMSAKPFSLRARLELPTSERELVLTPGEFRISLPWGFSRRLRRPRFSHAWCKILNLHHCALSFLSDLRSAQNVFSR